MKKNIGNTDKWIRIVAGLAIGAAGIYFSSWWGILGLVIIGTALMNFCPLYLPLRISTRK